MHHKEKRNGSQIIQSSEIPNLSQPGSQKLWRAYALRKSAQICIIHSMVSNFVSVSSMSISGPQKPKKKETIPR